MNHIKIITLLWLSCSLTILNAQSFIPHPDNPVLPLSLINPGTWNDPCVIKQGDEYWMYASSKNGIDIFDGDVVPFVLSSPDGINWTLIDSNSLLTTSPDEDAWDHVGVETPSVILFDGVYHMYYTAIALSGQFAIGHATSLDGLAWEKQSIILTPTNIFDDWMSYLVGEPGAVVYNDQIYIYFTGIGNRFDAPAPAGKSVIGLIISDDGFIFGTPQQVLDQGDMYPAADNYYGYSTPFPLVINDTMHLFFDVAQEDPEWLQVAIHHAWSPDGISDFIQDEEAIFYKSDFDWTQREIRAPAVLNDDGVIKMWFCGDDFFATGKWGIGYAWSENFLQNTTLFETSALLITPNPASNYLSINTNMTWDNFILYDITGKIIADYKNQGNNTINIFGVSDGIYFVRLSDNNNRKYFTEKLVTAH